MCDAICSKERALQFGGPRGLTVPGPLASFSKVDTGRQQIRPQNKARFSSSEEQVPASSEREKNVIISLIPLHPLTLNLKGILKVQFSESHIL